MTATKMGILERGLHLSDSDMTATKMGIVERGLHLSDSDMTATKMGIVERWLHLSDSVSSCLIATQRRCFIVARSCSFDPETVGS